MVRKEPHGNSPQISTVYYGKDYTITGTSGSWYQINVGGTTGYVMAGNFQVGNAPKAAPAQKSAPAQNQAAPKQAAPQPAQKPAPQAAPQPAPKAAPQGGNLALFKSYVNAAGGYDLKVVWNYNHPQGHRVPDYAAGYWQNENTIILGPKMPTSRYQWAATHEVMHHKQRLEYGSIRNAKNALGGDYALELDADRRAAAFLGYDAGAY